MSDETTKGSQHHDDTEVRAEVKALREREEAYERQRFQDMLRQQRQMEDTKAKVKRDLGLDDDWNPLPQRRRERGV